MDELAGLALRVVVMYSYALFLVRVSGKRSMGDLTPLDFLLVLIIGDQFDDVFWGDIPLSNGLVGMGTIFIIHFGIEVLSYRFQWVHNVIQGSSHRVVIRDGRFQQKEMAVERTPQSDVCSEMRLGGVDQLEEIRLASWEPNGRLSVLQIEEAKPVQKRDLNRLKEVF